MSGLAQRGRPGGAPAAALLLAGLALAGQGLAAGADPAAGAPDPMRERSDRIVSYRIEASLDPSSRTVHGRQEVSWRNSTPVPARELQIHLYLNAFKNEETTFMREARGSHRGHRIRDGHWGWIDVEALRLADGRDLLDGSEFIRPDDENPGDETVLRVPLPEPVPPGGSITFEAVFAARLPRVFARTGYKNDFYLVAQWFPKLGVYEESGWNCHQFHATSEFYADFGTYDVSLTVPEGYVVGATGAEAGPPVRGPDGSLVHRFVQEDVHDFAWTADPDFVREVRTFSWQAERDPEAERRMARILGLDPSSIPPAGATDLEGVPEPLRLGDVEVTLLLQPEHASQADRHFRAAFNGLRYYGTWYGRYPYETLTVVDPPYGGRAAGGMEYPTFITAGTTWIAPARRLSPESVTIHEFGHQFWYGLVANNEFEEAWLDEGLNSYSTGKVLERAYGSNRDTIEIAGIRFVRFPLMSIPKDPSPGAGYLPSGGSREGLSRFLFMRWAGASNDSLLNAIRDLPFLTFPGDVPQPTNQARRRRYLKSGLEKDELLRKSWEFYDRGSYGSNSYGKAVLMLRTLEKVVGEDTVALALRLFHQRYRFRHPSSDDFIATFNEAAGRDMTWFFDQVLRGSDLLDYGIDVARSRPARTGAGIFGPPERRRKQDRIREDEHEILVVARRRGGVRLPVTIQLLYEGGRTETIPWDGEYRWHRIRERSGERLLQARVGPPGGHALDADLTNNARTTSPDRWPALKWWTRLVGWAQNVLFFYSGIS